MNTKILVCTSVAAVVLASTCVADTVTMPKNWPMAPSEIERRFATEDFVIREVKGAGGGVTGASKLLVAFPDGKTVKVKWKEVPPKKADGWNNAPRKEIAVYEIQRWLLDEPDFLVPTSVLACIPLPAYGVIRPNAKPSIPGTNCALGVVSIWMEDVEAPKKFWDSKRFVSDEKYARYMADFNLLLYLVDHRDGRQGNLLLSTHKDDPRVFAVDNGIALDPFPWNMWVPNWYKLRVTFLRKETIDRLRRIEDDDFEKLGVVAEMSADENGILRPVPHGQNWNPKKGARIAKGRIQLGLTTDEIGDIEDRARTILGRIDGKRMEVR